MRREYSYVFLLDGELGAGGTEEEAVTEVCMKLSISRSEFERRSAEVVKGYVWPERSELVVALVGFGSDFPDVDEPTRVKAEEAITTWAAEFGPRKGVSFRPAEYVLGPAPARRHHLEWGSERE